MYQHEKDALYESYSHIRSVHAKIKSLKSKNIEIQYEQVACDSEEAAFELERTLIALIGRKDLGLGPLCNLTDGGEGSTNQSPESIEKRARWHRGRKRPRVSVDRMSAAQTARKLNGYVPTEETKQKQRAAITLKNLQTKEAKHKRAAHRIKRVQQWSLDGTMLLATFPSPQAAAAACGLGTSTNIRSCCLQLLRHVAGYVWRYENDDTISPSITRPVSQIDPTTGEIVKQWDELRHAAHHYGINNSQIISGIKGRYSTVASFKWAFADDLPDNIPYSRTVDQYTLNGDFIKRWPSVADISRELKLNKSGIIRCCTGHLKTSHGFIWKYAEDA